MQVSKMEVDTKLESLTKNTKYLEDRLVSTLTEKEEVVIKLKSEIVIYRNKLHQYKQKLKDSVKDYETKKIKDIE